MQLDERLERTEKITAEECAQLEKQETLVEASLQPFAEKYEILEKIGQGGTGIVYKVRHIHLDRILALKVLLSATSETALLRFQQEARVTTLLNHPNIVSYPKNCSQRQEKI